MSTSPLDRAFSLPNAEQLNLGLMIAEKTGIAVKPSSIDSAHLLFETISEDDLAELLRELAKERYYRRELESAEYRAHCLTNAGEAK